MTQASAVSYPDWKAPAGDGQMLIWPEPAELVRQTQDNHRRLSTADSVFIQGIPLPELRRRQRQFIGHRDDDRLLVGTGHQTELHHPGVWVKNALINALANKLGGDAIHLAVDTDAPKHLALRWPGGSEPITDDPNLATAEWTGLVEAPSPQHARHLEAVIRQVTASWHFVPMISPFLESMRRLSLESLQLPWALTNSIHLVDWELGLKHHALVTSPLWQADPYLAFVHHILARAGKFAFEYNAALWDYRKAHRLRTTARPMPDLVVSAESCEVPFWLDAMASGTRSRATVQRCEGGWKLVSDGGDEFIAEESGDGWEAAGALGTWLRQHQLRVSPRALTLTMFFRLLLVDQFVHGIGGGRYDQVTDRVIHRHFGIEPPRFSVTTATLYFPDAVGRSRVCLPCLRQRGHHLAHSILGQEKMELVRRIAALPRHSQQRQHLFYQMHRKLTEARAHHPALARFDQQLREAEAAVREESSIFDRELFFALQPRDRLESMIDRYVQAFP